jgi:hypothetical protein
VPEILYSPSRFRGGGGNYTCSVQILHTREVRLEEATETLYNIPAAGKKKNLLTIEIMTLQAVSQGGTH